MGSNITVQLSQVKVQKLFVGNLPPDAVASDIADIFAAHGAKVTHSTFSLSS